MLNCNIFMKSAPFAPLGTLFQNPHEAPIVAKLSDNWNDYLTAKEALSMTHYPECGHTDCLMVEEYT